MSENISEFSGILKKEIVDKNGMAQLSDGKLVKNILSDFAPGEKFRKEKNLLENVYKCNAMHLLLIEDTSEEKRRKAAEAVKNKLMDNCINADGAELIIKDICGALGWDTQKLFPSAPAAKTESSPAVQDREPQPLAYHEQQPITYHEQLPATYHEQAPAAAVVQTQKRRLPLAVVFAIAVIVIAVGVIYIAMKDDDSDNIVIYEIQSATSTTTITEASDTTTSVSVTDTTAATVTTKNEEAAGAVSEDPKAGKYVVTDIARFECDENDLKYSSFMTYDSNENAIYYVTDTGDLYKYDISDKTNNVFLTCSEISEKIFDAATKQDTSFKDSTNSDISLFGTDGVVFNKYTGSVFIFAHGDSYYNGSHNRDLRIYDVKNDNAIKFVKYGGIPTLSFIDEEEFYVPTDIYDKWTYYNMTNGDINQFEVYRAFYKIIDINDYYYAIFENGNFAKISNVYNAEYEEPILLSLYFSGADAKDNTFYYKDSENNVYTVNLENATQEIYISADQIYQTGKSFLGNGECTGLYITNDGGFVTYDKSDGKIKHVSMN